MNPFLWSGPAFLGLYFGIAIVVVGYCWIRTRALGPSARISVSDLTSDPYRIAYLRGGETEAIRVAAFNLVDRGRLDFDGSSLRSSKSGDGDDEDLRRPLDKAIIAACKGGRTPAGLLDDKLVKSGCLAYEGELRKRKLLPDASEKAARMRLLWTALGVLGGIAAVKVAVAVSQGRWNIGFLLILMIVGCILAAVVCHPRLTKAGREALSTLRTLVNRLEANSSRLRKGGATNEAVLLAAVLGLSALPEDTYAFVQDMYPKPKPSSGDGSGDGGSSCSSSCGGGGGCGGCGGD